MHSITQIHTKTLLFLTAICLFVGYNMTWQSEAVLRSPVSIISLLFLAIPAYIGLAHSFGNVRTLYTWLVLGVLGITIETTSIATGIPYGSFSYNNPLGGLLFGYAPWALILAWPPLVIGAWVLAKKTTASRIATILVGTILLVCFDLVMDPGAVALGFWSFVHTGVYYAVPYTNFIGWVISGVIGISTLELLLKTNTSNTTLSTLSLFCSTLLWTGVAWGHEHMLPCITGVFLSLFIVYHSTQREPEILTK